MKTSEFTFPLLCLTTGSETSTHEVSKGKFTVIDFWTTRCTRCPSALDDLNKRALSPKFSSLNVQFVSICCDSCDGAREILEQDDQAKWSAIRHYYMEPHDKERAKEILGFKSVPFYVVLDERGLIVQKGSKINWDSLKGVSNVVDENQNARLSNVRFRESSVVPSKSPEEPTLMIDDLDF